MLHEAGTSLENFPPMPIPEGNWNLLFGNRLIAEQQNCNHQQEQELAVEDVNKMNVGQKHAFDSIIDSVIHQRKKLFFLNGPAGTGKNFCYNAICHKLRGEGKIVLCVASSGIAAFLLQGG